MNETITILIGTTNPRTENVNAEIIGQLAIHEEIYGFDINVTHIKSGSVVADFEDLGQARKFAQAAIDIMDFDAYAQMIVDKGVKQATAQYQETIEAIRKLRDECAAKTSYGIKHGSLTRKALKARLAAQP